MLDILKNLTNDTYSFQGKNAHFKALYSKNFKKKPFFHSYFQCSHYSDRKFLRNFSIFHIYLISFLDPCLIKYSDKFLGSL